MPQSSRLPPDPGPLFAYGTLQFPRVLRTVVGRVPLGEPVTLHGFRAAALEQRVYPGLVPAAGGTARGLLLKGLTPAEWSALDAFEDDAYDVTALTVADGRTAHAYVWRGGGVRAEDWDAQTYAARCLAAYASPPD